MTSDNLRKPASGFGWGLTLFCHAAFLVVAVPLLFIPMIRVFRARNWVATSCRIERIDRSFGEYPDVEVAYSYVVAGTTYDGARASFCCLQDYEVNDFVKRHPSGLQTTCYFDPESPAESVLDRDLTRATLIKPSGVYFLIFFVSLYLIRMDRRTT